MFSFATVHRRKRSRRTKMLIIPRIAIRQKHNNVSRRIVSVLARACGVSHEVPIRGRFSLRTLNHRPNIFHPTTRRQQCVVARAFRFLRASDGRENWKSKTTTAARAAENASCATSQNRWPAGTTITAGRDLGGGRCRTTGVISGPLASLPKSAGDGFCFFFRSVTETETRLNDQP